jgi:hypothetical protein
MFTVSITTMNNVFKPELIETTVIVLKSSKPFVQMSYQYSGDFSQLTDNEAIDKVLEDFYSDTYKDKIQEAKLTELELALLKQQQSIDTITEDLSTLKVKGGNNANSVKN